MKKTAKKTGPLKVRQRSETVKDYLAAVRPDARAALMKLRTAIKAAAPDATEGISYQVPSFKQDGHPLVSYGAATAHCAFYVMSPAVMRAHAGRPQRLRGRQGLHPVSTREAASRCAGDEARQGAHG